MATCSHIASQLSRCALHTPLHSQQNGAFAEVARTYGPGPGAHLGSRVSSWNGAHTSQKLLQKVSTTELRKRAGPPCNAVGSLRDQATQRAEANVPAGKEDESWLQKVARRIEESQVWVLVMVK